MSPIFATARVRARALPLLAACTAIALAAATARAATFEVVHQFSPADGCFPDGALARGPGARLYGTTSWSGPSGGGTLFALDGKALTVLHAFSGPDGQQPWGRLVGDASGAIYGTTYDGGDFGLGVVYRFDPASGTFAVLHSFAGGAEGARPLAGLALDHGMLYGTTLRGGSPECAFEGEVGCGTVFKLDPATGEFTTLHAFHDGSGIFPSWEPTVDGDLLLATLTATSTQGNGGTGSPVEMEKQDGSGYFVHVVDGLGYGYDGGLALAHPGVDLWGVVRATLPGQDNHAGGGIYKMGAGTSDFYDMVFVFPEDGLHGAEPVGTLVGDRARGVLYGVTFTGGRIGGGWGTVYAYNPRRLKLTMLHAFDLRLDGGNPQAGLTMAADGSLYGVNDSGGTNDCGTVFHVTP
jgi:uncharacterized repeat protein (TIGR03803 family)